jgi:hypothetical protein
MNISVTQQTKYESLTDKNLIKLQNLSHESLLCLLNYFGQSRSAGYNLRKFESALTVLLL